MGQEESYTNNTNNSNINLISSNKQYLNFKINRSLFDFLYVIGRGGFGKVWKVRYKKTHKKYALKEMSKVKIIDRKSEKSIKNEKEFLSILHHPFLVNMMCSFQDYDNLYLVMDLLTGGDLRYHICHKKVFNEDQTKFFVSCVLTGLEYIHKNNIIHRDIKPENLVLDDKGYVAITDFGVAKKNARDNSSETSGTPGYMAPEVLCAQNHSFPVDFFAVGVIAFEFLHGFRPYLGRNRKEIKEAVLAKQVHIHRKDCINNGWSLEAGDFINRMIYRKPMKRLGYNGIDEIKNHPWFKDVNWEDLIKKKIKASFLPKLGDNFDKKYCEGIEKIGTQTEERYQYYMSKEKYKDLFKNYTFIRNDIQEVSNILYNNNNNNKIREINSNSNRNTTTSSKGSINNFNNNIKFNKNNNTNKNNINIMYQKLINNYNFNLNNNNQINNNSAIFNNINNNNNNSNNNNNNSNNNNFASLSKYLNRDNSTPNYYKHINNNSVNIFNFNNENQLNNNNNNNNNLSSTKYSTINLENNKNNKNKNLNISNKAGKLIYSPPHNIHQNSLNFSNNISNKTKEYIISIKNNNNNNNNNDYIINNNNNFVLQSPISSYSKSINKLGLSSSNSSANILGNNNIPKYYKIQHNSSNNNTGINNINNIRGIYQYYNNNNSNNNNFNNYSSSSNILKNNFLYDNNSNINNNKLSNNIDFKTQRYKRVSSSSRGERHPGLNKNSSMKFLNFNSSYYNNLNFNNNSSSNINNNSNIINNNINNYQMQNIKINSYNYNNKNNNNNMNPFSNISRIGNTGHYNFDIQSNKYINPTNSSPKTQRPITSFKKSSSSVSMNIQNIY